MKKLALTLLVSTSLLTATGAEVESLESVAKRATEDYAERGRQAAAELDRARLRIADEKAPLLKQMRIAEDRIITVSSDIQRLESGQETAADKRRGLQKNLESLRKTANYLNSVVHEGAKAFDDGLSSGEAQLLTDRLQSLQQKVEEQSVAGSADVQPAIELAEFLLQRTELSLGGYTAAGKAIGDGGNQVLKGTFAFVGPSTYFQPEHGQAGAVWNRTNTLYPVSYPLPAWNAEEAGNFFAGKPGTIVADITGGKALRLKETHGTVWSHIQTGGIVAYVIIAVGFLALLLICQKIRDLTLMKIASPESVRLFLAAVSRGSKEEAAKLLATMKGATRELFTVGLQQADKPKALLEESLQSVLLRQQLRFERRLPLLAVIATAAPLMGLLGTVVGMVKTFALITVFGTGNAGKLASGISQVLVATELGLIVAIPTLIAHGFLAHRIHKNVSVLEDYALQFVTAVGTAESARATNVETRRIPA